MRGVLLFEKSCFSLTIRPNRGAAVGLILLEPDKERLAVVVSHNAHQLLLEGQNDNS